MASLLLSFGTPMLRGGDEVLQTRGGNNNVYAQDNILSWIDWAHISDAGMRMKELVKHLLKIRKNYPVLEQDDFFKPENFLWIRPDGQQMKKEDWLFYLRAISCKILSENKDIFIIFNAFSEAIKWTLPDIKKYKWRLVLDTSDTLKNKSDFIEVMAPAWSVLFFEQGEK